MGWSPAMSSLGDSPDLDGVVTGHVVPKDSPTTLDGATHPEPRRIEVMPTSSLPLSW